MKAVNEISARQTLSSLCKHDVRKMCSIDYFTAQTKLVLPTFFQIMDRLQNKRIFHVRGIVYPVKYLPQYNSLLFLDPPYTFSSGFVSDVICCHVTSMPCDVKRAGAQSNSTGGSTDDGVCSCLLKRQYGSTQITLGDAENARPENDWQRKIWVWKMQDWKMTNKLLAMWAQLRGLKNVWPRSVLKTPIYRTSQSQTWYTVSARPAITSSYWYDIVSALQDIRITIATDGSHSRQLQQLVAYTKRQWLDRRSVGPDRLCVRDNRARTNNILESYHSGLRPRIQVSHAAPETRRWNTQT